MKVEICNNMLFGFICFVQHILLKASANLKIIPRIHRCDGRGIEGIIN